MTTKKKTVERPPVVVTGVIVLRTGERIECYGNLDFFLKKCRYVGRIRSAVSSTWGPATISSTTHKKLDMKGAGQLSRFYESYR